MVCQTFAHRVTRILTDCPDLLTLVLLLYIQYVHRVVVFSLQGRIRFAFTINTYAHLCCRISDSHRFVMDNITPDDEQPDQKRSTTLISTRQLLLHFCSHNLVFKQDHDSEPQHPRHRLRYAAPACKFL